ncbi:MAG: ABC transporter ATP-binding protein [SAR324 cluster bacterium]
MTPLSPAQPPAVQVVNLERRFDGRAALAGMTFDVAQGERLALLGPNGSGKSTLLRILATLLRPSGGSAQVWGLDVTRERAAVRHRLGTVFQSPSLDGKLSVRENLRLQGHLYGVTGPELTRRVGEAIERLGLAERARDRVETLSGGMKRRAELAKVLLHRPSVLLLDEPSTGLDPAARLDFWATFLAIQQERTLTAVVATHLMDEAERCTQAALLDAGRLVALDTPAALKARLGGPVVDVEAGDPDALIPRLSARLGLRARKLGNTLRIENAAGFDTAERIQRTFPEEVVAVRIGQPTLEDVFLALTGRRLVAEEAA